MATRICFIRHGETDWSHWEAKRLRDFDLPNCALKWFRFDAQGWHLEKPGMIATTCSAWGWCRWSNSEPRS